MYTTIHYPTRQDALAAFRKMIDRKREWVEHAEQELQALSQIAASVNTNA